MRKHQTPRARSHLSQLRPRGVKAAHEGHTHSPLSRVFSRLRVGGRHGPRRSSTRRIQCQRVGTSSRRMVGQCSAPAPPTHSPAPQHRRGLTGSRRCSSPSSSSTHCGAPPPPPPARSPHDTSMTRQRRGGHGTCITRPRHARDTPATRPRPWHVRGRRAPPPERALEKPRLRAHLLTGGPADTAPEQGAGCVRAADDAEAALAPEAAAVDAAAAAAAPSAAAVEEDTSRGGEARASGGAKLAFDAAGGVVALVAIACSSAIFAAMPALPRPGPSATNATAL
jgi:hypothetical protein